MSWWGSVSIDGKLSTELKTRYYIDDGEASGGFEGETEAASDTVNTEASVFHAKGGPEVLKRTEEAADGREYVLTCAVLPVLSYRHARNAVLTQDRDPRRQLILRIRQRMRQAGLARYMVNAGGRCTIDICHHLVNKRSALLWLLRHL